MKSNNNRYHIKITFREFLENISENRFFGEYLLAKKYYYFEESKLFSVLTCRETNQLLWRSVRALLTEAAWNNRSCSFSWLTPQRTNAQTAPLKSVITDSKLRQPKTELYYSTFSIKTEGGLPFDIKVSLLPLAINTGFRSEIGLAVIIFPPRAWSPKDNITRWNRWENSSEHSKKMLV